MVFFGVVTMVTESDPSFTTQWHDYLLPLQQWMNEWAKGLTMLWGRGLFYVFQGWALGKTMKNHRFLRESGGFRVVFVH